MRMDLYTCDGRIALLVFGVSTFLANDVVSSSRLGGVLKHNERWAA